MEYTHHPETPRQHTDEELQALYEKYDPLLHMPEVERATQTLMVDLYERHSTDDTLAFTTIPFSISAEQALDTLKRTAAGETLIHSESDQLAIESDGSYYPILDIKKEDMKLTGGYVSVWNWKSKKIFLLDEVDQLSPHEVLRFPDGEELVHGQLDFTFTYEHPDKEIGLVAETVSLYSHIDGQLQLSSSAWASLYAESGYEGHARKSGAFNEVDFQEFTDILVQSIGQSPHTA